ncbi:MAG: chromosomal replication initiator protein DnaA [Patescibacteria group bacterium]|nr:chromosomal replication initiator protein DnaA [Patescibacteria group bacterium]
MDSKKIWQAVLGELQVTMSRPNFSTWLKNTELLAVRGTTAQVLVPSVFAKEWLNRKFNEDILAALKKQVPEVTKLDFKIGRPETAAAGPAAAAGAGVGAGANVNFNAGTDADSEADEFQEASEMSRSLGSSKPIPQVRCTFDNFVVSSSNQLAHAAAKAVAQSPGTTYNPLFIYGPVGLGKTHLIRAIGTEIRRTTDKEVLYVTAEKFTNEVISAIQANKTARLKSRYRKVDVLMIDDIQFMAGKVQTQEEFFHTFNALKDSEKQIVLTSDRPPKAIATLEERLMSRLTMGMIADLGPPELETRIAILRTKARERGYDISDEVCEFIAKSFQQNVRELEGALIRVAANAELIGEPMSVELAERVLGSMLASREHKKVSCDQVLEAVSWFYDVSVEDLKGPKRLKEIVKPRQMVMYLLREESNLSYPKIGRELGGRDHTTAIHAVGKIGHATEVDEPLRRELSLIKERLYG